MKYTISSKNIKSVAKIIEKIAKNKTLVSQMFYPTAKKQKVILNNIGIKKHIIVKSNVSIFKEVVIEIDFMHEKHFIRIHNNDYSTDDFNYPEYRAFLINCGDIVEIKNNIMYLRTEHSTNRNYKANEIVKFL